MIPRRRRFPLRPYTRPTDPAKVAAAGMRVFGKRYTRIAHLFTPEQILDLDKRIPHARVVEWPAVITAGSGFTFPDYLVTFDFVNGIVHHPSRPLPVSQGEPE